MRWGTRGIGVVAVAAVAVCLPVGAAIAPDANQTAQMQSPAATSPASPFTTGVQLAERTLADPTVAELSGLAASRLHPGVLYAINDSGNDPVVYAVDSSGGTAAKLSLPGAPNSDWEALAPGRDADGNPVLWIGDIGDNSGKQPKRPHITLIRIFEPAALADGEVNWTAYRAVYPDGPHNAEALVVHPVDGRMWVVTKSSDGPGAVYQVPGQLQQGRDNVMERVMAAPAGITDGAWELSPVGEPRLVLSDYWQVHRLEGQDWVSALGPLQLQREAVAWPWLPDGQRNDYLLLGSEGAGSRIVIDEAP